MKLGWMQWMRAAVGVATVSTLWACLPDTNPQHGYVYRLGRGGFALRAIEGCDDLEGSYRNQIMLRNAEAVEQNRQSALSQIDQQADYCACYRSSTPDQAACERMGGYWGAESDGTMGASGAPPAPGSNGGDKASEYTTTNNQVVGVDEADFVKNDGAHIYMVAGDQFLVLAAWPAADTHVISSRAIEGVPLKLFVEGGRALIYSDVGTGQSCQWDGSNGYYLVGGKLKLTVFDIADLTAPRLERELVLSGSFVNARRIGAAVHTVVSFPELVQLSLSTWPENLNLWDCGSQPSAAAVNAAFDALLAANQAQIDQTSVLDMLPSAVDKDYDAAGNVTGGGSLFVDCQNFFEPPSSDTGGFLSVVSLAIDDDQTLGAATIIGRAGEVYASGDNLYVAVTEYLPSEAANQWGYYAMVERTLVHKFALDLQGGSPAYRTSGSVPGRILNQFSMDEHDSRLRLATTEGHAWDPNAQNNVFVLEEQSFEPEGDCGAYSAETGCLPLVTALNIVGEIRGLAKSEDIRSARFDGDRGFMVTFKKTDPLFTFDLSNPYAPVTTGELKIPGFSTYLHFMDANHLLTIGFDAADQGSFAWFTGIILQIFDVSDMQNPRLTFKESIGSRGTTSDATDDHLAFTFFRQRNLLAIPMGICEGGNQDGGYGSRMTFNGLLVYRVTVDEGFTLLGGVDHRDAASSTADCYNWWQDPNSQVSRSLFLENFVYSFSDKLKVNDIAALDQDLASITLPASDAAAEPFCYGW
ncbi:MAG: beta-propeller domain-containing protein [Deltaproteobacteria bacterium]|nr:beta-propeller domain-containing protein [Deltaproteobacteria bacterium]